MSGETMPGRMFGKTMSGNASNPGAGGSLTPLRVFGAIFAALWLLHLPLLRLPYFWDEAGYFIPAARDILLTGDLIPHTTLSNAHPPLVMLWLALCWKLTVYSPLVTRTAMLLIASFGFTALWLLARHVSPQLNASSAPVATATVVLTALSPTVFSQSVMAHLDIAAFSLVLWTLYSHIRERPWQAAAFAALAALAKETTVAVTLTLAAAGLLEWWVSRRRPSASDRSGVRSRVPVAELAGVRSERTLGRALAAGAAYLLALLPLTGWYAYHFHRTGHIFGNPDYLRYNVGATLTPLRILIAALTRLWHAVGYMNLFVLTAAAALLLWDAAGGPHPPAVGECGNPASAPAIAPNIQLLLALVVLAQVAEFSLVGGALLARYMIPAIPLVVLLAVNVLRRHAPRWQWWIAGCAAAFVAALLFNPPWFISPEDNLTWVHFVRMHQEAAHYLEHHYPHDRILTAWPASDELSRPFLGYVAQPLSVARVENFTAEEILRAQQQPESFDTVLAFSTKYEPPHTIFRRIPGWTRLQTRYFDFHQDLPPTAIARLLHGRIVWQRASPGEWVAVIEIDKVREAKFGGVPKFIAMR